MYVYVHVAVSKSPLRSSPVCIRLFPYSLPFAPSISLMSFSRDPSADRITNRIKIKYMSECAMNNRVQYGKSRLRLSPGSRSSIVAARYNESTLEKGKRKHVTVENERTRTHMHPFKVTQERGYLVTARLQEEQSRDGDLFWESITH